MQPTIDPCRRLALAAITATLSALCLPAAWSQAAMAARAGSSAAMEQHYQQALQAYERNHWPQAYAALVPLADNGHPGAARMALQMWQWGPRLYGQAFDSSAQQRQRWAWHMACAGPEAPDDCARASRSAARP